MLLSFEYKLNYFSASYKLYRYSIILQFKLFSISTNQMKLNEKYLSS